MYWGKTKSAWRLETDMSELRADVSFSPAKSVMLGTQA